MTHQQQRGGDRTAQDFAAGQVGTCRRCGKRSYPTRKSARAASRRIRSGGHLSTYECPTGDGRWHLGHLPAAVRRGVVDRDTYTGQSRASAVYAHAAAVGQPLTVTFVDPRDGAAMVDALLEAAAHTRDGREARRWERMAEKLGDSLDRAAVPDYDPGVSRGP